MGLSRISKLVLIILLILKFINIVTYNTSFKHITSQTNISNKSNISTIKWISNEDKSNTKHNYVNNPLEVLIGPIIRVRAKMLKEALNGLVQNISNKMHLEELGTSKEHEGQPLIHVIQVQEEFCLEEGANVSSPIPALLGLFFLIIQG
jgi:hypothetical protein